MKRAPYLWGVRRSNGILSGSVVDKLLNNRSIDMKHSVSNDWRHKLETEATTSLYWRQKPSLRCCSPWCHYIMTVLIPPRWTPLFELPEQREHSHQGSNLARETIGTAVECDVDHGHTEYVKLPSFLDGSVPREAQCNQQSVNVATPYSYWLTCFTFPGIRKNCTRSSQVTIYNRSIVDTVNGSREGVSVCQTPRTI